MLLEAFLARRSLGRKGDRRMARAKSETSAADTGDGSASHATRKLTPEARLYRAETITKDHVLMSTAAGFVPGPGLDLAASLAIQLALLGRLSRLYDVPYSENVGKGVIFSLISSVGGIGVGGTLAMSAVKVVPIVGTALGVLGMPVMMGAFTYALGKVFTQHFATGGTFLDFDAAQHRRYFREMFRRGRGVARDLREEKAAAERAEPAQASPAGA
jgi:uncharacterized protein (DUF697 family)